MRRSVTRILALDLGTTTGWCLRDGNDVKTGRWKLHRSQGEKGIQLGRLVRDAIQEHGPDLVGFEEPVFLTRGMAALALRYGLQMIVQVVCEQARTAYVGVPVSTLKKHATGKGNAKKPQMIQAAMDASGLNLSSDEADAYWVADYLINSGVSLGEVAVK